MHTCLKNENEGQEPRRRRDGSSSAYFYVVCSLIVSCDRAIDCAIVIQMASDHDAAWD